MRADNVLRLARNSVCGCPKHGRVYPKVLSTAPRSPLLTSLDAASTRLTVAVPCVDLDLDAAGSQPLSSSQLCNPLPVSPQGVIPRRFVADHPPAEDVVRPARVLAHAPEDP